MDFLSAVYGVSRLSWKLLFDFISQQCWLGELRAELAPLQQQPELTRGLKQCHTGTSREFPAWPC